MVGALGSFGGEGGGGGCPLNQRCAGLSQRWVALVGFRIQGLGTWATFTVGMEGVREKGSLLADLALIAWYEGCLLYIDEAGIAGCSFTAEMMYPPPPFHPRHQERGIV